MSVEIEKEFIEACGIYSDALFRYAFFKTRDRETSKDLVQDTFTKTWDYLRKGNNIDNLKAFFYKTLSNLIIDFYRKNKPEPLESIIEAGMEPGFDGETQITDKIDIGLALKLLDQIPREYKDVLVLRYVEELSIKEIANMQNESENTITVRIHRGAKKVKQIFKDKTKGYE